MMELNNALGGMLRVREMQNREQLTGLQSVLAAVGAAQRQQEMQRQAQLDPLRMEMQKYQISDLQRKAANDQALEEAIGKLPTDQQAYARIAGPQFVAGLLRNPSENLPDIGKLIELEKRYRAEGRDQDAARVAQTISNREAGGTSQHERAYRTLLELQKKIDGNQPLTREEDLQAQAARSILSRSEMRIDPTTKEPYWAQPLQVPSALSVGGQGYAGSQPQPQGQVAQSRGPVNSLPNISQGRAPIDSASEKELQLMGDARALASDLSKAFKPEFGGYGTDIVGDAVKAYGRRFAGKGSDPQQMAQFWELYEQWITDMRKEKFGATLTGNELRQFEALRAKPSQSASQISNNLNRQLQLVEQSMGRRMTSLARQGVNQSAIEGTVGWGVSRPSSLVSPGGGMSLPSLSDIEAELAKRGNK